MTYPQISFNHGSLPAKSIKVLVDRSRWFLSLNICLSSETVSSSVNTRGSLSPLPNTAASQSTASMAPSVMVRQLCNPEPPIGISWKETDYVLRQTQIQRSNIVQSEIYVLQTWNITRRLRISENTSIPTWHKVCQSDSLVLHPQIR